ncbi:MAG: XisI protein [Cyanothece sp. SIO2G6]|nr:XisI protein [Cyanothece sp. SIO2G6]
MDKVSHYRKTVQDILIAHSQIQPAYGEIEMGVLFDQERDRYQVLRTGWLQKRRVYGALIHIDIKDEKIWIQYDGTEVGVANELVERDIPKDDIVLAYHSPFTAVARLVKYSSSNGKTNYGHRLN